MNFSSNCQVLLKRLFSGSLLAILVSSALSAQPLTGVWRGEISKEGLHLDKATNLELKLVNVGDSLFGTAYYFNSQENFQRYSVKGYRNPFDGGVTWWDEDLLQAEGKKINTVTGADISNEYAADFNCPGEGIMKLDGKGNSRKGRKITPLVVHLNKINGPIFEDEWDQVIEDFSTGDYDPSRVAALGRRPADDPVSIHPAGETVMIDKPIPPSAEVPIAKRETNNVQKVSIPKSPDSSFLAVKPRITGIEEKFQERKKILTKEIPIGGDSIVLHFYDHAEIDGDSISLFLNNRLLFQHILLKASPFTIVLPTSELNQQNELVMVAENLGSIPPNTSLMVAYVKGERYEARLESSENESAMIRFVKE